MADWYEYPNSTDTQGMLSFFGYINRITDGLFFPVILLVIWFVSFVGVFGAGGATRPAAARAFTFASFLCSILGIMTAIMGFFASKFMYLFFILTAVGLIWMKIEAT